MNTSAEGRALIEKFEGRKLTAYQDGGGVWTIGVGHTGKDVYPGRTITEAECDALFDADLAKVEAGLARVVKVPLNQCEYDALSSFAFNVGLDENRNGKAEGLGDSTLLRLLNQEDRLGAAKEFPKWSHDEGKIVPGLLRRRLAEKNLFERTA